MNQVPCLKYHISRIFWYSIVLYAVINYNSPARGRYMYFHCQRMLSLQKAEGVKQSSSNRYGANFCSENQTSCYLLAGFLKTEIKLCTILTLYITALFVRQTLEFKPKAYLFVI